MLVSLARWFRGFHGDLNPPIGACSASSSLNLCLTGGVVLSNKGERSPFRSVLGYFGNFDFLLVDGRWVFRIA